MVDNILFISAISQSQSGSVSHAANFYIPTSGSQGNIIFIEANTSFYERKLVGKEFITII